MIAAILGLAPATGHSSPPRAGDGTDTESVGSVEISTQGQYDGERHAAMMLAYEWPGGLSVLVSPGLAHRRAGGASETVLTDELAAQYRLTRPITVSAERFGDEGGAPTNRWA